MFYRVVVFNILFWFNINNCFLWHMPEMQSSVEVKFKLFIICSYIIHTVYLKWNLNDTVHTNFSLLYSWYFITVFLCSEMLSEHSILTVADYSRANWQVWGEPYVNLVLLGVRCLKDYNGPGKADILTTTCFLSKSLPIAEYHLRKMHLFS